MYSMFCTFGIFCVFVCVFFLTAIIRAGHELEVTTLWRYRSFIIIIIIIIIIIPDAAQVGPEARPATAVVNAPVCVLGCR